MAREETATSAWQRMEALARRLDLEDVWRSPAVWAVEHAPMHAETRAALELRLEDGSLETLADVLEYVLDPARFCGTELVEQWARAELWLRYRQRHHATLAERGEAKQDLEPGCTRDELEAWAITRGLSDWLDRPVGPWIENAHWLEGQISFAELITGELLEHALEDDARSLERMLQTDAIRLLEERVPFVEEARREEREREAARARPDSAPLAELYDALRDARAELRATTSPRPARAQPNAELGVREGPVRLHYQEHDAAWCGDGRAPARVTVTMRNNGPRVRCGCYRNGHRPCAVKLAALDAMLNFLGRPEPDADEDATSPATVSPAASQAREALARLLQTPAWSQTLSRIAALHAKASRVPRTWDGMPARFGWRVEPRGGGELAIFPALVRDRKRDPGVVTRRFDLEHALRARDDLDEADRELLELVAALPGLAGSPPAIQRRWNLLILSRLQGHPRVYLHTRRSEPLEVVRRIVALQARREPDGGARLVLTLDGDPLEPRAARALRAATFGGGVDIRLDHDARRLELIEMPELVAQASDLIERFGDALPPKALPQLLGHASDLTDHGTLELTEELRGAPRPAVFGPILRLRFDDGALHAALRDRPLAGGPSVTPGEGPDRVYGIDDDGAPCHVLRDFALERERARKIARSLELPITSEDPFEWTLGDIDDALDLISRARELTDDLDVVWDSAPLNVVGTASPEHLAVEVDVEHGWLRLGGRLILDALTELPLDDLLTAAREHHRYLPLGDGDWIRIESRLLREIGRLTELTDDEQRVDSLAADTLVRLEAQGARLDGPERWLHMAERIRSAHDLDVSPPDDLKATLRPYQLEGVRWLARLSHWAPGACLADDMGLGKTVQALALALRRAERGPTLVVLPTSLREGWRREAARFTPTLRVVPIRSQDDVGDLRDAGPGDLVITSYTLLARHIARFHTHCWATLILDEAHAIKNPRTRRARTVFALDADFRLALTGTPLQNRTGELWSLFRAIVPGLLGGASHFRKRFARPIERENDPRAREALATLVAPFILRRLKREVARDLPPRTDVRLDVELSPAEAHLYNTFRRSVIAALEGEGEDTSLRFKILSAITRLRQLACHPRLYDPASRVASSKLAATRELVQRLRSEGHRALLFSQFTAHLTLVREALEADGHACAYLDGSLLSEQRQRLVDDFQENRYDVFLLSIKAGGTGLNLTAADYVIHLDPWWNPAVEDQATSRAHRIGQDKPVTVYRLVTSGTIEEAIYDLHDEKRTLIEDLLSGTGSTAPMTLETLRELIAISAPEPPRDDAEPTTPSDLPNPPAPFLRASPRAKGRRKKASRTSQQSRTSRRPPAASTSRSPLEAALEGLESHLQHAYDRGEIAMDATVHNYLAKGRRMIEWMLSRGLTLTPQSVLDALESYQDALHDGRVPAPSSDHGSAPNVARYLADALEHRAG